ncbi:MAG: glycosyltransferase family 2 protein, partial [Pseudomonadota bacterium]
MLDQHEDPLVSIVTVSFNAELTISATIESVASQKGVRIEHIIVDGASTDGTISVVERYRQQLALFISEPDDGLYFAMNKGAAKATGTYLAFLNADDVYAHDGVVAAAITAIERENVEASYADLVFIDSNDGDKVKRVWTSQPHREGLCWNGWMPAHPTLFMQRRIFDELGGFDVGLKYQSDLEFCARAFEVRKIQSVYVADTWVRMRLGGISTGEWGRRIEGNWESYQALKKLGLKRNPISFFTLKFASKLPQWFKRKRENRFR